MNGSSILTKLEHFLLSATVSDSEPLHTLYADAQRRFGSTSLTHVIGALVKLARLGYVKPSFYRYESGRYEVVRAITEKILLRHCSERTEEQLRWFPEDTRGGEYFFEITEAGRIEEAKDVYDSYYPKT